MLVGRLPSVTRNGVCAGGEPFGREFRRRLAEGQRLGLGEQVGHQQIVLIGRAGSAAVRKPMKSQGISFVP